MGTNDLDQAIHAGKTTANRNLVHESEAQRQHARVKLPGHVELSAAGGTSTVRLPLHDLSYGGVCFIAGASKAAQFKPGIAMQGQIVVSVDGIAFTVPVTLQVVGTDAASGRVGARFQDLGSKEVAALRHLISAYLAGEIVGVGELLHTLGRDNFTKGRVLATPPAGRSLIGQARAVTVTLLFLLVGLAAASYTLGQAQHALLVTDAQAAKVAGTVFTISMPREGTFFSLVPEDGVVKKGAPLGSFEASALDVVRAQAASSGLSAGELDKLLGQTIKGTISSPCDCRVQASFVTDNQYVSRGDALFELTPMTGNPNVLARFSYEQAERVRQGMDVNFRVSGDSEMRSGKVSQIRIAGGSSALDNDLLVTVVPTEPLAIELVNRPVRVSIGESYALPSLIPAAMAKWTGKP